MLPKTQFLLLSKFIPLLGFVVWIVFLFNFMPLHPKEVDYVKILLLAAPLWLVPIGLSLMQFGNREKWMSISTAIILAIAYSLTPSILSAIFSLPWLLFSIWISWKKWIDFQTGNLLKLAHLVTCVFLLVGAAWAFADRLAFQPLGFDTTITLLTAAHFHYAGFCLMLIAGLTQRKSAVYGVLIGVPTVAVGITTSHFAWPAEIETMAATIMAIAGMWVGVLHLFLAWKNRFKAFSWLWLIAGFALIAGMILALLYGWRYYFPIPSLSIPTMYALHGTLNAIGFAAPAILGWYLFGKQNIN